MCKEACNVPELRTPMSRPDHRRNCAHFLDELIGLNLCSGPATRYRFAAVLPTAPDRLETRTFISGPPCSGPPRSGPPCSRRVSKNRNRIVHFSYLLLRKSLLNF